MNYLNVEFYVLELLRQQLPPSLHYHGYDHTVDVVSAAERIAGEEGITQEDLVILKTAALFHDSGFISSYQDHEEIGCEMAKNSLQRFGYSEGEIAKISALIMATKMPQNPQNLLEKILCDADLDYLGRDDYETISSLLLEEWKGQEKQLTEKEWKNLQVEFLTIHRYWTASSQKQREPKKQQNLETMKKLSKEI